MRSRPIRVIYWLVLAASALLAFVTFWIVVPAPNELLLPLSVAAPELSPVLLAIGLVMVVISSLYSRALGTARLALVLSLVSVALSAWPLLQVRTTMRRFDETMTKALTVTVQAGPINYLDVFRPPRALPSRILHAIPFASRAGETLTLEIYRPQEADGPLPIVIQVYGGAWQRGAPSDNDWFSRDTASRGYIVVAVDYRHAPQSKWPAQLDDVRDALRWVRAHAKEFGGDPNRMIVLGRSSGAQLAMVAAYEDASPSIKGVVSFYGPVDLAEGWRHPPTPDPLHVRTILETYLGGAPAQVPERYRAASPITYATKKLPPTLLIYGQRDHIVEARFGEQLHRALTQAGTTSVLLDMPWSEHAFDILPNGLGGQVSLQYVDTFIDWAVKRP